MSSEASGKSGGTSGLKRVAGGIQDLWVAAGIAFVLFLIIEGLYIGQRTLRARYFGSDDERAAQVDGHPYRGQEWYRQLLRERGMQVNKWDAWRTYWSYPLTGAYINIDSLGRRRTIQPVTSGKAPFRVLMLGGSAMWGYTARDSATIPSLVARKLAADNVSGVELVNMAQPGYVLGQELATLRLEVEHGDSPAMAVFFGGINDVRTSLLYGEPGRVFFEPRLKQLYEVDSKRGFVGSLVASSLHSAVLQRLLMRLGLSREWVEPPTPPELCGRLGGYFHHMHDEADALADRYGFQVLMVQQPMHATTNKPLTPFEQSFMQMTERNKVIRSCSASIDSAMTAPPGSAYVSMAKIFDDHKETVFLDDFGHVTEAGNAIIADRIAMAIEDAVKARTAAAATPPKPTK